MHVVRKIKVDKGPTDYGAEVMAGAVLSRIVRDAVVEKAVSKQNTQRI